MMQIIAILALMFFTWLVAIYATVREEPEEMQAAEVMTKAA